MHDGCTFDFLSWAQNEVISLVRHAVQTRTRSPCRCASVVLMSGKVSLTKLWTGLTLRDSPIPAS